MICKLHAIIFCIFLKNEIKSNLLRAAIEGGLVDTNIHENNHFF